MHWRRKWKPTSVFLPGESQGQGSLVGCHLWGHTESDTTEVTELQQQPTPSCPPPSSGTREPGTCEHLCWTHSWPLQSQVRGHPQSGATVTRPASLACDRLGPHWVCSPQTPLLGGSEAELLPRLLRSVSTQRRCAPVTSAPRHPGHVLVGASAAGSSFPGEPGTTRAWRHEEAGM